MRASDMQGSTTVSYSNPYQRALAKDAQAAVSNPRSSQNRSAPSDLQRRPNHQPATQRQPPAMYKPFSNVPVDPSEEALAATFIDLPVLAHHSEEDSVRMKTAEDGGDFTFVRVLATPAGDVGSVSFAAGGTLPIGSRGSGRSVETTTSLATTEPAAD